MLGTELTLVSSRRTGRLPRHGQLALRPTSRPGRSSRPTRRAGGTIERELAGTLAAARLDPRQSRAVAARLGWDGRGGSTLAAAGELEGYTRERVRQLEDRVRKYLRQARPVLPATGAALAAVTAAAPARRTEVALALRDAGLSRHLFDPAGVISAARLAGLGVPVELTDSLVIDGRFGDEVSGALSIARRLARRPGAVPATHVARALGVEPQYAERLLSLSDDAREVADGGWFAVAGSRPSRNERRIRKVLAVAGPLSISDLAAALARGPRATHLPEPVLAGLCASLPWVSVDRASGIVAPVVPLEPRRELSATELVVLDVLRDHGPLDVVSAAALAAEAGTNEATAAFVLRYSPITRPVGLRRVEACGPAAPRPLAAAA